jgi:hypothetical protein
VTGDFSSQMEGASQVGTAEFGDEIIKNMWFISIFLAIKKLAMRAF